MITLPDGYYRATNGSLYYIIAIVNGKSTAGGQYSKEWKKKETKFAYSGFSNTWGTYTLCTEEEREVLISYMKNKGYELPKEQNSQLLIFN